MTLKKKLKAHFKVTFWHLLNKEGRQERKKEKVFN
jgi:hypothetical protein